MFFSKFSKKVTLIDCFGNGMPIWKKVLYCYRELEKSCFNYGRFNAEAKLLYQLSLCDISWGLLVFYAIFFIVHVIQEK